MGIRRIIDEGEKMNDEIVKIQKAKKELKKQMSQLIENFCKENSVAITNITYYTDVCYGSDGEMIVFPISLEIEIKM